MDVVLPRGEGYNNKIYFEVEHGGVKNCQDIQVQYVNYVELKVKNYILKVHAVIVTSVHLKESRILLANRDRVDEEERSLNMDYSSEKNKK